MGTNAIVGGGVPQAAGFAFSHRLAGTDAVSVSYFGDGAVNIGSTLETMNLAAAWKAPVCFFIENNQYAVSTTVEEATGEPRLSARGPGFGIASLAGRRHGPARDVPGDAAGGAAHALRSRPRRRRGRDVPLLPPERCVPRQRVRLPQQGGGAALARPRPAAADGRARRSARSAHAGAGGRRPRPGTRPGARGRRRAARAGRGRQARAAPHQAVGMARPGLRRRRGARRHQRAWWGSGSPTATRSPASLAERKPGRRGGRGDGPPHGDRRPRRRHGRGRAQA
nr:thiamine pyrophosphate-dependent enzyme [Angustibacter aerolatus]